VAKNIILKLQFEVDQQMLKKAETQVKQRFQGLRRVAGATGGALNRLKKPALVAGGAISILTVLLAKATGNFQELSDTVDGTLARFKAVKQNSKLLDVTAGQLQRLITLGEGAGLEDGAISDALARFREARLRENSSMQKSDLSNFSKGDIFEDFQRFIVSAREQTDPLQQRRQLNTFLGSGSYESLAPLLDQELDINALAKRLGIVNNRADGGSGIDDRLNKLAKVEQEQAILKAQQQYNDIANKASIINTDTVTQQVAYLKTVTDSINKQLKTFEQSTRIQTDFNKIINTLSEKLQPLLGAGLENIINAMQFIEGALKGLEDMAAQIAKFFGVTSTPKAPKAKVVSASRTGVIRR
jgi:hypothetical protein